MQPSAAVTRKVLLGSLFLGYAVYFLTRKTAMSSLAILQLSDLQVLNHSQYGQICSIVGASYAISKVLSGAMTDNIPSKHVFCSGLVLMGVVCAFVSFSNSYYSVLIAFAMIGLVQGVAWPSLVMLMKDTIPSESLGKSLTSVSCVRYRWL